MAVVDGFKDNAASKWTVALGLITIVAIGVAVIAYTVRRKIASNTLEDFLTARNSSGALAIGWSMFASAVGSWVITAPASFASFGGIITAFTYAFATAIPLIFIGWWGSNIRDKFPEVLSFSDFTRKQFGVVTQVMTVLISLLNMAIFATAEYTGIYALYSTFVGMGDAAASIVLVLAFTTLAYTTYGGLKVSILTDQAQGISAVVLTLVAVVTLWATFSKETVRENYNNSTFEVNEFVTGAFETGYSTMFTLPLSLTCATIFSEAWWARAWAASSDSTLKKGAYFGAFLTFLVVLFWGIVGVLVAWSGIPDGGITDGNLVAFYPFILGSDDQLIDSAIAVAMILLATIMAEGVIDSLMNGIGASVSGALEYYLPEEQKKHSLSIGRFSVVILNIPIIFVSLQQYDILSLFLIGNMITICCFFPLFLGFFPNVAFLQRNLSDWIFPVNFVGTIIIIAVYSATEFDTVGEGLKFAFWDNLFYQYTYFLVAILGTVFLTGLLLLFSEFVLNRNKTDAVEDKVAASDEKALDM